MLKVDDFPNVVAVNCGDSIARGTLSKTKQTVIQSIFVERSSPVKVFSFYTL